MSSKEVIVKVQLSLASSDGAQSVLVYDEERVHVWEGEVSDDVREAMDGEPKKYFLADVSQPIIRLIEEVEAQGW